MCQARLISQHSAIIQLSAAMHRCAPRIYSGLSVHDAWGVYVGSKAHIVPTPQLLSHLTLLCILDCLTYHLPSYIAQTKFISIASRPCTSLRPHNLVLQRHGGYHAFTHSCLLLQLGMGRFSFSKLCFLYPSRGQNWSRNQCNLTFIYPLKKCMGNVCSLSKLHCIINY